MEWYIMKPFPFKTVYFIKTKCILINFWRHLMSNNTSFKNKSLCIKIAIVATVSWNGEWVN